ncbi:hypothetical protein [Mesobacterium pallidum]|uniref:hypothetical protein n=1 Tax=Mesobacterium pallidum TaxID=2872037 RepID=UPI001EE37A71|nr:hypothetical protein [Mesobacterium pallidum]
MQTQDTRPDRFGQSQTALRAANRDLPHLRIYAQAHVGPPNRIAFVVVHGVGEDRDRRRRVRAEAGDLLQRLGYTVELEAKRDACDMAPRRPVIDAYGRGEAKGYSPAHTEAPSVRGENPHRA